jgi:hypothetical protein
MSLHQKNSLQLRCRKYDLCVFRAFSGSQILSSPSPPIFPGGPLSFHAYTRMPGFKFETYPLGMTFNPISYLETFWVPYLHNAVNGIPLFLSLLQPILFVFICYFCPNK